MDYNHPYDSGRVSASALSLEPPSFDRSIAEPLSIVGMAFHMPQGIDSDENLWSMLVNKKQHYDRVASEQTQRRRLLPPRSNSTIAFRGGHSLKELPDAFDAPFFSIAAAEGADYTSTVSQIVKLLEGRLHRVHWNSNVTELEYQEIDELLYINRNEERSIRRAFGDNTPIKQASISLLDGFCFVVNEDPETSLPPQHINIKVHATGLNFQDYLVAIGQVDDDIIGVECSGTITRVGDDCGPYRVGDRVAAITSSIQTYARAPVHPVCLIPEDVSFHDACASLIVYPTAYYCLVEVARLQKGESILIHSGAGGTGQATIQIAQYIGAEIYVTIGTLEKRAFLKETFAIPDDCIFSSRNPSFAQGLMRQTNKRGADLILNSLSGENLVASWESLAPCGRLIEIGKRGIHSHNRLPMWQFRRSCTFAAVDLEVVMNEKPKVVQKVFERVISLIGDGIFSAPKPLRVNGVSHLLEALKSFQSGNMYGKAVVEMRPDDTVEVLAKPTVSYYFDPTRTYLIAGGLGGLGREIAFWMSTRGARNLILLSRKGAKSEAAKELVRRLTDLGVHVETPACDISNRKALESVLTGFKDVLPPIAGCIQSAMVLRDSTFENMTFDDWKGSTNSKIQGTWNLHELLPLGMDFFLCLASLSGIIGTGGQANYAASNAYLDEFSRYRCSLGQRTASIDLGWMEAVGVTANHTLPSAAFNRIASLPAITKLDFLALLEYCCDPNTILPSQMLIGFRMTHKIITTDDGLSAFPWLVKSTFKHLAQAALQKGLNNSSSKERSVVNYTTMFRDAASIEEAQQAVLLCLRERLSKAFSIQSEDIDISRPLQACGVDSLLVVELRNYLARTFDADIAVFDLMNAESIEAAGIIVARKSALQDKVS